MYVSNVSGYPIGTPVKTVGRITYIVLAQTLNHAQPQPQHLRSPPELLATGPSYRRYSIIAS